MKQINDFMAVTELDYYGVRLDAVDAALQAAFEYDGETKDSLILAAKIVASDLKRDMDEAVKKIAADGGIKIA